MEVAEVASISPRDDFAEVAEHSDTEQGVISDGAEPAAADVDGAYLNNAIRVPEPPMEDVNAWILLSLVNTVTSIPEDSIEKLPITTIELSITFRLLDGSVGLSKQTLAVADLLTSLEV